MIWSDEKKFNLDGPDGFKYYWHDLRKEKRFFSQRVKGGGSLMVWAGFCPAGKLQLAFVPHKLNSLRYQQVLNEHLLPFYQCRQRAMFMFMQDNAPCHASRSTHAWLADQNVPTLEWPSCSPDLNPIENLWGIIVRRIYADNKQYQSVDELRHAVELAWRGIEQETMDNLVLSMENRMFQVINGNGGPTDY